MALFGQPGVRIPDTYSGGQVNLLGVCSLFFKISDILLTTILQYGEYSLTRGFKLLEYICFRY